jgi:hypothetical protein
MKRTVLTIIFLCLIVSVTDAQIWKLKRYEVILGLGPSFFFGDIGGFSQSKNILGIRDITLKQIRFNVNGNIKYRVSQPFSLRLSLTSGLLHATDVRGSNELRGYESSTIIFEPSLLGEYYFIKNKAEDSYLFTKGRKTGFIGFIKSLDFYVYTGIGGLAYSVSDNKRLENRGLKTSGFTAVLPFGLGGTLIYSPNFNFGVELAYKYSLSDNLDGYTSQYSRSNDVYYLLNFTITYKMKTGAKGWPSFR